MTADLNGRASTAEKSNNQEPFARELKKRPGPASRKNLLHKKPRLVSKEMKKVLKKQTPLPICFLCGLQFKTQSLCDQHSKIHMQNSSDSLVFPCNVCGKNVKNLKMHLRQHKQENKKDTTESNASQTNTTTNILTVTNLIEFNEVESNETKVEEASSSTDAVYTNCTTTFKEPENDVSSNLTEAQNMDTQCKDTVNNVSASIEQMASPPAQTNVYHKPPIIVEDYPIIHVLNDGPEVSTNEDEPSQSTQTEIQQTVAVPVDFPQNGHTADEANDDENVGEKKDTAANNVDVKIKWQCEICKKRVAFSYKRIHMKKYHIPEAVQNISPSEE